MAPDFPRWLTGVGRFLRKELVAAWSVFLFFLTGFLLLTTLINLALAQFSTEITTLYRAVVAALIAAKAALLLDETPLARSLENYQRIVAVAVKTFFYGTLSLMLSYLERFLDALRREHSFDAAIQSLFDQTNHYPLIALALGVSIVVVLYFSFLEISWRMGEGAMEPIFPASRNRERFR